MKINAQILPDFAENSNLVFINDGLEILYSDFSNIRICERGHFCYEYVIAKSVVLTDNYRTVFRKTKQPKRGCCQWHKNA